MKRQHLQWASSPAGITPAEARRRVQEKYRVEDEAAMRRAKKEWQKNNVERKPTEQNNPRSIIARVASINKEFPPMPRRAKRIDKINRIFLAIPFVSPVVRRRAV